MKKSIFILSFVALLSCNTPKKGFDEKNLVKPVDLGEYHKLSSDDIKIFLPQGFKVLTDKEIKEFHQQIKDEKTRYYFEKGYETQRNVKGNFYDFYNEEYAAEVTIHTLPYMPFSKSNAGQLLYYLRKSFEEYQKVTGIYHNKMKAVYSGDKSLQYFKAMYRLTRYNSYDEEGEKENFEVFKTVYLITSKRKTFMVTIMTPFEIDFDPFIRKFKL